MPLALYRKYRSKSLAEIVGQEHITTILGSAIKSGKISHAYLLTGPRGVGKTSIARILAHEINGLAYDDSEHLDIIEIDAASNNGVDDVRDLREKARIAPVSAPKKIYIIDEVHMLSKPAFNALLKTLEEPPEHVVFILATTDVEKLPATIISRTQRFTFRAISKEKLIEHLRTIADSEKIKIDDEALEIIAERGDGSFRDSISLLDQLSSISGDKITAELVENSLGLAPVKLVKDLLVAVEKHDVTEVTKLLRKATDDGISAVTLTTQLTRDIQNNVAEKPQLLELLDKLLDVSSNSQPGLKLLSVLASSALEGKTPRTAALSTPVLEVSATIAELEQLAEEPYPQEVEARVVSGGAPSSAVAKDTDEDGGYQTPGPASSDLRGSFTETSDDGSGVEAAPIAADAPPVKSKKKSSVPPADFDWDKLIEYTRKEYTPVYSILSKCKYELDGSELSIYTGSAFFKKKLDDPKYSVMLYSSLEATHSSALTIHTIPTTPKPKDSKVAAIADIMGGGEEVSLTE